MNQTRTPAAPSVPKLDPTQAATYFVAALLAEVPRPRMLEVAEACIEAVAAVAPDTAVACRRLDSARAVLRPDPRHREYGRPENPDFGTALVGELGEVLLAQDVCMSCGRHPEASDADPEALDAADARAREIVVEVLRREMPDAARFVDDAIAGYRQEMT